MTTQKATPTRKPRAATSAPRPAKRAVSDKSADTASARRSSVEIKIGVLHTPREIVLDVDVDSAALVEQLTAAQESGQPFIVTDVKGRQVLIPTDKIAYIELGEPSARRVGFGGE